MRRRTFLLCAAAGARTVSSSCEDGGQLEAELARVTDCDSDFTGGQTVVSPGRESSRSGRSSRNSLATKHS